MDIATTTKHKELLQQLSYECLLNTEHAVNGYSESENIDISLQFMNQAFQSIKLAQTFYLQTYFHGHFEHFEEFFHQFGILNIEFLTSIETKRGLQWSLIELDNLKRIYGEFKISLSD
jgi:hypothetical protein